MEILFPVYIILLIPILIAIFNYKKVVEYLSTLHKNLFAYILLPVSFTILYINYQKTVKYRESTPSWDYFHDPFWFTYLFYFNTLFYLFVGLVISGLLTISIRKITNKLRRNNSA